MRIWHSNALPFMFTHSKANKTMCIFSSCHSAYLKSSRYHTYSRTRYQAVNYPDSVSMSIVLLDKSCFFLKCHAILRMHSNFDLKGKFAHVLGSCIADIDDVIRMLLACLCPTDDGALHASLFDEPTGRYSSLAGFHLFF